MTPCIKARNESLGIFLQKNYVKRRVRALTVLATRGYNIYKFVLAPLFGAGGLFIFGGGENAQIKGDRKVLQDG